MEPVPNPRQRAIASGAVPPASRALELARASAAERDWARAHELLRDADERGELDPQGLELYSDAARWVGRYEGTIEPLERAHAAYTAARAAVPAARTALALQRANVDLGRDAVASTWLARAAELLEGLPEQSEHGWLAWSRARSSSFQGDAAAQRAHARAALEIAQRCADRDLEALALIELAHVAAAHDPPGADLALADRATAIVVAGEAGILASGEVLCNATWLYRSRGAWDRAQQWVDWSNRWVERERVEYFPGMCRVHRAEVLRVRGRLGEAERECLVATEVLDRSLPAFSMFAYAELGEVRRRRGDAEAALGAFSRAAQLGWDPQPGMALVLLAMGHQAEALRMIERVFRVPPPGYLLEDRANLLGARTTVALANADLDTARTAADALAELASGDCTAWDEARSAEARGRLELATRHSEPAIDQLTRARRTWTSIDAPFELATTSVLLAEALAAAGDRHQARLAREAARELFGRLGAPSGEGIERRLAGLVTADRIALAGPQPPAAAPAPASSEARLVREGDYWSVSFAGRTVRLKHGRGVQYLAELLARPGVPIWAIELAASPEAAPDRPPVDRGDAGPLLDARARQEYAARLRELEEELADARACSDPRRVEAARSEMDALGRELAAAVGLGGRHRRTGAAAERARQSVTKAIRGVLRKLAAEHEPLGDHLLSCVRTGTACVFQPDKRQPITWSVDRGGR